MVLSFSFAELGPDQLAHDSFWLTPAIVRTEKMQKVKGGWPTMAKAFYRVLFWANDSGLSTAGVARQDGTILFAKHYKIVGDGDGFRILFDWRGAQALRCCLKCDVVNKNSELEDTIDITCSGPSRFKPKRVGYWEDWVTSNAYVFCIVFIPRYELNLGLFLPKNNLRTVAYNQRLTALSEMRLSQ